MKLSNGRAEGVSGWDLAAAAWYALATLSLASGILLAMIRFPGEFDWPYRVISALASRKHNPGGGIYFSAGLGAAGLLLYPVVRRIGGSSRPAGVLLKAGLIAVIGVALERILFLDLSDVLNKAHEALALAGFLASYAGVLTAAFSRRDQRWLGWLAAAPLTAIGVSQLVLYASTRDLGWVDPGWRELGVPLWLSFAFWQWLAAGALWMAVGLLGCRRLCCEKAV